MIMIRWKHRWINPKAVSKTSPVQGEGVFAKETINKGEVVGVLGGIVVPKTEHKEYLKELGHIGIQIHDDFFICPSSREEHKQGIFNHSCEPNCGFNKAIILVAMRNIKAGEELCFDYAFCETEFEDFKCNCKKQGCRKRITKNDWRIRSIQEKYFDYFSPYIKEKIKKRTD